MRKTQEAFGTILEGSQARSSLLFRIHDVCEKLHEKKNGVQATQLQTRITCERKKEEKIRLRPPNHVTKHGVLEC